MNDRLFAMPLPNQHRLVSVSNYKNTTGLINTIIFGVYAIKKKTPSTIMYLDNESKYPSSFLKSIQPDSLNRKVFNGNKDIFLCIRSKGEVNSNFSDEIRSALKYLRANFNKDTTLTIIDLSKLPQNVDNYDEKLNDYSYVLKDSIFQISNINAIMEMNDIKNRIAKSEAKLKELQDSKIRLLNNISSSVDSSVDKTLNAINRMKWIEKLEYDGERDSLVVYTKQSYMQFVPNIGLSVDTETLRKNHNLYKIFKNQLLGLNFIAPADRYFIPSNYNIEGNLDTRSWDSPFAKLARYFTFFKGSIPHIGNSGKCYGEFQSSVVSAQDFGLDFLLTAFYAFLQSANLQDGAGRTVTGLPMGTPDGKITCWPAIDDTLYKNKIRKHGLKDNKFYLSALSKPNMLEELVTNTGFSRNFGFKAPSMNTLNANLELVKQRESEETYNQILKNIQEGKCAIWL